jgi:hypothetical protein
MSDRGNERQPPDANANPGYHIRHIAKGTLGEVSKIREELEELEDATEQGSSIMALVELSDLYGAMDAYLKRHHPSMGMADVARMASITQRAFRSGQRTE